MNPLSVAFLLEALAPALSAPLSPAERFALDAVQMTYARTAKADGPSAKTLRRREKKAAMAKGVERG